MRSLLLFATLVATGFIAGARIAAEELYKEHPLSYWRQKLRDSQHKERRSAAAAFAMMDPAIAKEGLAELIEALHDDDAQVRYFAAETLGKIGPDARSALPALLKLVDPESNEFVAGTAGVAIAGIDPEFADIPKIVRTLVRHEQVLGKAATKSPSLVGAFL